MKFFLSTLSSRGQSNEVTPTEGQHYCVDENTERRNHYLDLAGIENYTSRFEGKYLYVCGNQRCIIICGYLWMLRRNSSKAAN